MCRGRGRENQIGKKFSKLAVTEPKLGIACGLIHPAEADEPGNFRPFFGGRRRETHVAENAYDVRAAFRLDRRNAAGNASILSGPRAQRSFQARTFRIGATSDETSPSDSGSGAKFRCLFQPLTFSGFPAQQHSQKQLFAILEMPVKASFRGTKVSSQDFDADGFDTVC